ncbi:hypothetical protein EYF80_045469 [Liparis tanakae]|uniref:Uncharacterized protein n=1 Tax=Liparis tanakae TaxID=230148 RepID=A0A4Z2FTY3_9TELE|nr:hypothetical protein EYF80_045469 [Liparis tanakae]
MVFIILTNCEWKSEGVAEFHLNYSSAAVDVVEGSRGSVTRATGNVSKIDRPIAIDGLATAALGGPDCLVADAVRCPNRPYGQAAPGQFAGSHGCRRRRKAEGAEEPGTEEEDDCQVLNVCSTLPAIKC